MLMLSFLSSIKMTLETTRYLVQRPGSHSLVTTTIDPAEIESHEIVIRIKAVAISPGDCNMVDFGQKVSSWPSVPGLDGAGIVEAVGATVSSFAVGDRVLGRFAHAERSGSFQTLAILDQSRVAKMPKSWSFEESATLAYVLSLGSSNLMLRLSVLDLRTRCPLTHR